ncbi:MAG: YbhB/YbcL family Raf kinase inhibitor-like protein [Promethearchaeota archaeon]|nr:MAG: YbhB/YbcL family Raf kinase inhibitor-like protein [Candidatus Lokiarchaeota archaeon]
MELTSKDFNRNEMLKAKFAYRKGNVSPHLKWENTPSDSKSFAILCNDPDAGNWIHWVVINISKDTTEVPQGGPVPGQELKNDFGDIGYGGPAPPSGTHKYSFKVFALDCEKLEGVDKNNFLNKVEEHKIAYAEIVGLYKA